MKTIPFVGNSYCIPPCIMCPIDICKELSFSIVDVTFYSTCSISIGIGTNIYLEILPSDNIWILSTSRMKHIVQYYAAR